MVYFSNSNWKNHPKPMWFRGIHHGKSLLSHGFSHGFSGWIQVHDALELLARQLRLGTPDKTADRRYQGIPWDLGKL
jgi:hypothetical protein